MLPVTRIYESEHAAHHVVDKLIEGEIPRSDITVVHASDPNGESRIDAEIERGAMMSGHRRALKAALAKGRSIVTVTPDYSWGSFVTVTMNRNGAVDTDTIPDYTPHDPAPFSEALGLPVLIRSEPKARLSIFNSKRSFGLPLLIDNAAPFSSLFGLKLLSSKKGSIAKGSSVERMSGNPAPFSSLLGLKLLSSKRGSRAKGSSVERMSDNPAPFSRFLGLRVLSKRD